MTIDDEHWLIGAKREPIAGGAPMNIRRLLVIHFTAGATAKRSIDFWRTPDAKGASAHIVIDRDGTVYQCRPFDLTCGHAGKSRWVDPTTGTRYEGLNSCSIGIELANAGDNSALAARWSKLPVFRARHRNGGPARAWEDYPEEQLASCTAVSRALVARYNLDDVTGHDCIAPERKNDPGPAFEMEKLRRDCGFTGMPVVFLA